jgi:uncharacterized protein YutE (UPF0331/DUF86 family)
LVDADRAAARLERLRDLLERLDLVREAGEHAYLADPDSRAMSERRLELAVQAEAGLLADDLADRMGDAARQRNLLVHLYLDIDDRRVFSSLESLDDLRRFAKAVAARLD